jgi:elongation factor P--(R)-beta-lysine ligase
MTRHGPPDQTADYLPTATLTTLRDRAKLLGAMRRFFDDAGYFEVETPILSSDIVVDAWLEPFVADWLPSTCHWRLGGSSRYLQTSPEFAMKRLLAAGAEAIYQLGKVFRNGEVGQRHNPEFTMLEWYREGDDHHALMQQTERLVQCVFGVASELLETGNNEPRKNSPHSEEARVRHRDLARRVAHHSGFERLSYDDAFARHTGQRVLNSVVTQLHELAARHHFVPPPGLERNDRDGWLNWLLAELVEPHLGCERPTFLFDYPASQAALARVIPSRTGGPSVAERFELYIDGVELCNGYHELTDPAALRDRVREQLAVRAASGLRPLPAESRLLAAMDAGLPASSGNALGVDRLVMLALGQTCLADVIAFPFDRA